MARYRKLYPKMYADEKFQSLSHAEPSGQYLWIYLLTGPYTTNVPGLLVATEAGMAERLGWSLEAFREAFRELERKGMVKACWKASVISIPNAIKYCPPESPNVVQSWSNCVEDVPECELKQKHLRLIRRFLQSDQFKYNTSKKKRKRIPEPYLKAFAKATGKASRTPSRNQEQEQKQLKEKGTKERRRAPPPSTPGSPLSEKNLGVGTPAIIEDRRPGHLMPEVMELQALWADVWGEHQPTGPPTGDHLVRMRIALEDPRGGYGQCEHAIRGHHQLASRDGSQLGRTLRHVFPEARVNGRRASNKLDWDRFEEYIRAGIPKPKKSNTQACAEAKRAAELAVKEEQIKADEIVKKFGLENLTGTDRAKAIIEAMRREAGNEE